MSPLETQMLAALDEVCNQWDHAEDTQQFLDRLDWGKIRAARQAGFTLEQEGKTDRAKAIVELAVKEHDQEGVIEVETEPTLSEGEDNGCYVKAWVWVSFEGTPFDKEKG